MKLSIIEFIFLLLSDMTVVAILFYLYSQYHIIHSRMVYLLIGVIFLLIILRATLFFLSNWFFYRRQDQYYQGGGGRIQKGQVHAELPGRSGSITSLTRY